MQALTRRLLASGLRARFWARPPRGPAWQCPRTDEMARPEIGAHGGARASKDALQNGPQLKGGASRAGGDMERLRDQRHVPTCAPSIRRAEESEGRKAFEPALP